MAKSNTKQTAAAATYPIPQNQTEAETAIAKIGAAMRSLDRIDTTLKAKTATAKTTAEEQAKPHKAEIKALTAGVQTWAEANRTSLTNENKTKTARLASGTISWRLKPAGVRIAKDKVDQIIKIIREKRLTKFLRQTTEIDREAMLKYPTAASALDGVSIGSEGETFSIEPTGLELAPVMKTAA